MRAVRRALAAVFLAALPIVAGAQAEKKIDLTGKWAFTVASEFGNGTPTVTITQKGDSITGRYSSQALGDRDFAGTFKDGKIAFALNAESGGQAFSMSFAGTHDSKDDSMKGAIDFAGMATGTFTGKRQKPEL